MAKHDDDDETKPIGAPADWQGPQQAGQPWDNWSPEQHAKARGMLETMDSANQFRSSGPFVTPKGQQAFAQVAGNGGVSKQDALALARYKMALTGAGPVPQGDRTPEPDVAGDNSKFFATKPGSDERKDVVADAKSRGYLTQEGRYDKLTGDAAKPIDLLNPPVFAEDEEKQRALARGKALLSSGRINKPTKRVTDTSRNRATDALLASVRGVES